MSGSNLEVVIEIRDGSVSCPCGCGHSFKVKRSSHGAQKADKQTILDDDQRKVVVFSRLLEVGVWHTKEQLREMMNNAGVFINPNPLNSALSCLVRLDFFKMKRDGHDVLYQFNESRYNDYLKMGGLLK